MRPSAPVRAARLLAARACACIAGAAMLCAGAPLGAQDTSAARVVLDDRGLVFSAPERATEISLRFYIHPLITLQTDEESGPVRSVGLLIRRARVSLGGTALDPRLRFVMQFGLSR